MIDIDDVKIIWEKRIHDLKFTYIHGKRRKHESFVLNSLEELSCPGN